MEKTISRFLVTIRETNTYVVMAVDKAEAEDIAFYELRNLDAPDSCLGEAVAWGEVEMVSAVEDASGSIHYSAYVPSKHRVEGTRQIWAAEQAERAGKDTEYADTRNEPHPADPDQ